MSAILWAGFEDAVKIILTGSSSGNLSPEQRMIFLEMLAQGGRDEEGNALNEFFLPGVTTQKVCVNEHSNEHISLYYIPSLFIYMLEVFKELGIFAPPVNLDYLNSLEDELDVNLFTSDRPSNAKADNESLEVKKQWILKCKKIAIEQELNFLKCIQHGGDPLKLEAQKRMRAELEQQLIEVLTELEKLDSSSRSKKRITSSLHFDIAGCLPGAPQKKDEWFLVITDLVGEFYKEVGRCPNEAEAWNRLRLNPPSAYGIKSKTHHGEPAVFMDEESLGKRSFSARWRRYTAPKIAQ